MVSAMDVTTPGYARNVLSGRSGGRGLFLCRCLIPDLFHHRSGFFLPLFVKVKPIGLQVLSMFATLFMADAVYNIISSRRTGVRAIDDSSPKYAAVLRELLICNQFPEIN